ncbi:MAG TPA: DUF1697 domain-containing protein [Candidatus Saccharimonadales bacterium]
MKYVALVRGINVGGNHRVPKAEFQAVLEGLGFQDVIIYLNSGNAVFSSDHEPKAADVQAALEEHFGFSIPTLILSGEKIKTIAAAIPETWTNDPPKPDKSGQKSDVLYLFDEANTADVLEKVGYRPEVETMIYVDGAIVANISRANQSKYSLIKVIGTPLYQQMTVRNITTTKKLAELVG